MADRRLQRKFEWAELLAVLPERLHDMVLALSLPSQFSPRTIREFHPIEATVHDARWCDEGPRSVPCSF